MPHTFIGPESPAGKGILQQEMVMYADAPLRPSTAYGVQIEGHRGVRSVRLEWTFATGPEVERLPTGEAGSAGDSPVSRTWFRDPHTGVPVR